MELRHLQYFLSVVELKSFSKAATALHIAQPAISRQVKQLEEELGVQLLYRDGRGVVATEVGQELAERAQAILQQLKELQADISGLRGVPTGEILLGMPPVVGAEFIATFVKEFRRRYPQANVRVVEGFSYQIVDWLQMGRLDLGVVYDPEYYRHIEIKKLASQSLYLVGKWDRITAVPQTRTFTESIRLPLIMPVRPNSLSQQIEDIAGKIGAEINLQIEVDSIFAIRKLVKQGEGYTILPYAAVYEDVERGELFASLIEQPRISRPLAIAFPNRGILTLTGKKLIELLEELAKDFVASGKWSNV